MIYREFSIDLDVLNKKLNKIPVMEIISQDYNANIFNITLLNNFQPVDLTDIDVGVFFLKPDKKVCTDNIEIVDAKSGKVKCKLSTQTMSIVGRVQANLTLTDKTTNEKITTTKFMFTILKNYDCDTVVKSTNELNVLQKTINEAKELKSNLDMVSVNLNLIDLAINTEKINNERLDGLTSNFFIETFQDTNNIDLVNGTYDSVNKNINL